MASYNKLYTPADSGMAFIDHQPPMLFGVASMDRATLINNATLLAKVAKEFQGAHGVECGGNRILHRLHLAPTAGCLSGPAGR